MSVVIFIFFFSSKYCMVKDPTVSEQGDFYTRKFHNLAFDSITTNGLPEDRFTVKTMIPLHNCEPLVGMRSMTCSDFTAFKLSFLLGKSDIQLSKFSNGATGVSVSVPTPSGASLALYTLSPGFEENAQGKVSVDLPLGSHALHVSLDIPSLDQNPEPILTLSSTVKITKHVDVISQLIRPVKTGGQAVASVLHLGVKFQPCGHCHAGLGLEANVGGLRNIHSSAFFVSHSGGSFSLIGKYGFNGTPHSLQFLTTSQMKLWKHKQTEYDKTQPYLISPYPTVGLSYDLVSNRASAFADISLGAWNPSAERERGVNLNIKVGVNVLKNNWKEPFFGVHLNASEA